MSSRATASKKNTKGSNRKLDFGDSDDEVVLVDPPSTRKRGVSTNKKQSTSLDAFLSPKKKKAKTKQSAPVVTPPQVATNKQPYVPIHIYKNVHYQRRGERKLDPTTQLVVQWIKQHYDIPKDFETNRQYGPHSGSCWEDRLVTNYNLGKLTRKQTTESDERICTDCATIGHTRDECPSLV